jgi:excisionase family DNA binding protein
MEFQTSLPAAARSLTMHELGLVRVCYSVGATATILSTSRPTVYAMVHAGKLRLVKFGPKKSLSSRRTSRRC